MAGFTNPVANFTSIAYMSDALLGGDEESLLSKPITLLAGQSYKRGALLGKITIGAAAAAAKAGGNTGNGVFTLDGATPLLKGAQPGVYKVVCMSAAANSGIFWIFDPQGNQLGQYVVGAAAFADQIKFTIADGAADFVIGDEFDVTVAAGSGKYTLATAAATDGSAVPDAVLVADVDATAGDQAALAYVAGVFNAAAMTFGAGLTAAGVADLLRTKDIYLKTAMPF